MHYTFKEFESSLSCCKIRFYYTERELGKRSIWNHQKKKKRIQLMGTEYNWLQTTWFTMNLVYRRKGCFTVCRRYQKFISQLIILFSMKKILMPCRQRFMGRTHYFKRNIINRLNQNFMTSQEEIENFKYLGLQIEQKKKTFLKNTLMTLMKQK